MNADIVRLLIGTKLSRTVRIPGRAGVPDTHPKEAHVRRTNGLDRSAVHLLHRASQSVTDLFSNEIQSDLTPRQLAVLTAIAQNEGCSQKTLVDTTGVDRSTLSDMVRRLNAKGLLERRRTKEDARAYAVKLTQEGQRILKKAEPLAKRVDEKIMRVLGNRGYALLDNLATLVTRFDGSKKP